MLLGEIHSIARNSHDLQHARQVLLTSQPPLLLDGPDETVRALVLATTKHTEVGMPDPSGRAAVLRVHLASLKCGEGTQRDLFAERAKGFSGPDLAAVCREAGRGFER